MEFRNSPHGDYYQQQQFYNNYSPSPTPSPLHPSQFYPPQRPTTAAHFRHASSGGHFTASPRFDSTGQYATAAGPSPRGQTYDRERVFYDEPIQRSSTRVGSRRASGSVPQRPQTVRPGSSHQQKKAAPAARAATKADAERYGIPAGYSLKNWDPTEEPIMLLGSIFDSNSLGKWIYDWTVYRHGPGTPISDMAGDLWLLLIQLSGKIKRSDAAVPKIRAQVNRNMVEDFIESGERLQDKLRILLKRCEAPMLNASKKKENLGKGSGVEFVDTLFGRERELAKTEKFMTQTRLWNLRFDTNCSEIIKHPTM